MIRRWCALACLALAIACSIVGAHADPITVPSSSSPLGVVSVSAPHNNNWAVLVSTSRYWFNYRHTSNALAMYHTVKRMGIPDSQIILMLPDEYACNPRNVFPGRMYHAADFALNLYSPDIEVDYRGTEVSVQTFLRLLTGRHVHDGTPRSQRLSTNADSNLFIYMSGHGGNNFLKFQDNEEMNAQDIRDAFQQMWAQQRYRSILFILDTCQAATLFWELNEEDTPNVITLGSSKIKENSYSLSNSPVLGLSLSDRATYYTLDWFERNNVITHHNQQGLNKQKKNTQSSKQTIADLFASYDFDRLRSHVEYRNDLLQPSLTAAAVAAHPSKARGPVNPLAYLPVTDYFGALPQLQPTEESYELERSTATAKQPIRAVKQPATSASAPSEQPKSAEKFPLVGTVSSVGIAVLLAAVLIDLGRPAASSAE